MQSLKSPSRHALTPGSNAVAWRCCFRQGEAGSRPALTTIDLIKEPTFERSPIQKPSSATTEPLPIDI
jgi:hypothetical protein